MNQKYRTRLPGIDVDFFDTRAAVEALAPGAYDRLPYTSPGAGRKPGAAL